MTMLQLGQYWICLTVAVVWTLPLAAQDGPPEVPPDTLPATLDWGTVQAGFTSQVPEGIDNPMSAEKILLGRKLFFDPILSVDQTVACATCHRPDHGFALDDTTSTGVYGRRGKRNVPSLLNRGFGKSFFWDGRSEHLEQQALEPIIHHDEMGNTLEVAVQRLRENADYVDLFAQAFGGDAADADQFVTAENLGKAIGCFERTLVGGNSPVDQFRASDYSALSERQRHGMWLFESRGRCWQCHAGENMTDELFHNTGVGFGLPERDLGRFEFTRADEDRFRYKTPTLRGVALTPPYMHDGSIATLEEVVRFYSQGGSPDDPSLDPKMKPLNLTEEEILALADFLRALTPESADTGVR